MSESQADYAVISRMLAFMPEPGRQPPALEALAAHLGMADETLREILQRWSGLPPEAFLQAQRPDHARSLLREDADIAAQRHQTRVRMVPGLCVRHEIMPAETIRREGASLAYGFHPSPFGEALLVTAFGGLCGLGFVDHGDCGHALADMQRRWPRASLQRNQSATAGLAARAFQPELWRADNPLPVVLIGTDFEASVWEALLALPLNRATTYGTIARQIGRPRAARAVGAAVGKNPISFAVPCHRVLGSAGALTGYHWGLARKQAMLAWEAGRA